MICNIQGGTKITVGAAGKIIDTAYRTFILKNNSANDISIGADAGVMTIKPGETFPFVLTAVKLYAQAASDSELQILYVVRD